MTATRRTAMSCAIRSASIMLGGERCAILRDRPRRVPEAAILAGGCSQRGRRLTCHSGPWANRASSLSRIGASFDLGEGGIIAASRFLKVTNDNAA